MKESKPVKNILTLFGPTQVDAVPVLDAEAQAAALAFTKANERPQAEIAWRREVLRARQVALKGLLILAQETHAIYAAKAPQAAERLAAAALEHKAVVDSMPPDERRSIAQTRTLRDSEAALETAEMTCSLMHEKVKESKGWLEKAQREYSHGEACKAADEPYLVMDRQTRGECNRMDSATAAALRQRNVALAL